MIPGLRRAAHPPVNRQYRTRDERIEIAREVRALRPADGESWSPSQIRAVAERFGVGPSVVRRGLKEIDGPAPKPRAWQLPYEASVRIAMHKGRMLPAYEELAREIAAGTLDLHLPSYKTLNRVVNQDPGLKAALKGGPEELQRFLLVGEHEPLYRNELAYMDASWIPIRCRDQYDRVYEGLWLLTYFEAFSRIIPAHAICLGAVTGQLTADVYLAGAMGRELSPLELMAHGFDPREPVFIGGITDMTVLDNALANKAEEVAENISLAGSRFQFARPHMATDKAKQERCFGTLKPHLEALPGWTKGPKTHPADGHPTRTYGVPDDKHLPRVEAVVETIGTGIDDYNWNHVISSTGSTPIARFLADTTPIRLVSPTLAWRSIASRGEYKVHQRGVKVDQTYRTTAHPDFVVGTTVEVRQLPGVPRRTFFGTGGHFRAEVKRHAALNEDDADARRARNSRDGRTVRAILREAGERLEAEGLPDAQVIHEQPVTSSTTPTPIDPPAPVPGPAPRRRGEQPITAGPSLKVLKDLEWNPDLDGGVA